MAVTRRDGGVVTLPSCLQVARHQLAFPFPSQLRPSRCFLNDRILSFSMEIILSRVCVNTANSSNLGTKACSSIHYTQFFKMISIRYGWLDVYIYMVLFNDSRSTSRVSCARRMRVSFPSYLDTYTRSASNVLKFLRLFVCRRYTIEKHMR